MHVGDPVTGMTTGGINMDNLELEMRNLRFCMAYWELALLAPADEGEDDDAAWQRRLFREELAGFHQLVVHRVTHEDVMIHARESLRLVWKDCNGGHEDVANENWARVGPEDVKVGVENDLQLVAPGIWIGSTETLAYTDLLKDRDIQHLIYCTTTKRETRITREDASHLVVSLLDLPRLQFEEILAEADGVEQLKALSSPSWNEISRIASTLNDLIGTRSDGRASRAPRVPGDGAVLLYCNSGMSASIAMCAALLLTRYNFPLDIVMPLIRAARRDILPSKHLWFQLEQLDRTLESASRHE